jgi:DNA-binding transcriptional MerR regulator
MTHSRADVQALLQIAEDFLVELERERIVSADAQGGFSAAQLERIRICRTLHHELDVNLPGIEVALRLMDRIAAERRLFQELIDQLRAELGPER